MVLKINTVAINNSQQKIINFKRQRLHKKMAIKISKPKTLLNLLVFYSKFSTLNGIVFV